MAEDKKQTERRDFYGIEPLNYLKQPTPVRQMPKPTRKRRTR